MFLKWLENRQALAQAYANTLSGVPQDPDHHPEGDVLTHVRLVRKAIPKAVAELRQLQQSHPQLGPALAQIDFSLSPQEEQILALAAWLHDIGKATATTIDDRPWTEPGPSGKIRAIGHQDPEHYLPQLEKLQSIAPPETVNLYVQNRELLNFLIEHHMDFASGQGFGREFVSKYFQNGVAVPSPEMKLLLILMWADKMGRKPEATIAQSIAKNAANLATSIGRSQVRHQRMQNQGKAFEGSPEEFAQMIRAKPMAKEQKLQALRNKFPYLGDDEVARLIPEGFRRFVEVTEMQPTVIQANIPVDPKIQVLSDALKQGDSNVQVYVVGGAVRDYLFHQFHGQPGTKYQPKDMDLTTNLSEEEILTRLRSPRAVQQGIRVKEKESVDTFGVVFASVQGSETFEIAPFRKDIGIADGRRPDRIERGTIHDDAMRRDLTINNLYYDFDKGTILDFNAGGQGLEDIKAGVARPVGDPFERFNEDKLRILRLVRFFSRFNPGVIADHIDPRTEAAIHHFGNLRAQGITPERIFMEFTAGLKQSLNTAAFLKSIESLGLMDQVFPGLQVDSQGIDRLGNSKNPRVALAWLLRGNRNVLNQLNQLKYPNEISDPVQFLIDALNFGPENAMGMIRNRDKRLVKGNAAGPGGKLITPQEAEAQNRQITQTMQQDLAELARIVGDPNLSGRLLHLGSYQQPNISGDELMKRGLAGKEIGDEQRRQISAHYQQSLDDFLKAQTSAPPPGQIQ